MDDLLKAISAAPKAIAELETKSLVIKQQIGEVREAIEGIKKSTWAEVASQKDESGKKAYPNSELRIIEVEKRLQQNERYQKWISSLKVLEESKAKTDIEIQQFTNQFSADRYRLRLYTAEKMERAASSFSQGIETLYHLAKLLSAAQAMPKPSFVPEDCPF